METFDSVKAKHAEGDGHGFDKKAVMRTFWVLLIITVLELVVGMFIAPHFHNLKLWFNVLYIIFTLAKAFYIVAEFMHLGHEIRNMVMTIAVPCLLFIWFITAFLWDGNSYKDLKNTYDPFYKEQSMKQITKPGEHMKPHHAPEAEKPGALH